jgi:trans-aconitate 2-methyltransferase
MWDPAVYRRYADERSRPFADLVARIEAEQPRTVVDLGCGDGVLTATLADRWPEARVRGIDASPEMIAKAKIDATLQDIATWRPDEETDVVVTNAALQWVPGHQELIGEWMDALPAGAWFAMQVPGNFDAPSHRSLRELAAEYDVEGIRDAPVDDAAGYASRFLAAGGKPDAWETTYLHLLPATGPDHPVLTWMEGTALRPVKAALDDTRWRAFRASLGERLAAVYPARSGHVAFPFRRIFVVAHKGE